MRPGGPPDAPAGHVAGGWSQLPALLGDKEPNHDRESHDGYHGPSQQLGHLQENDTERRNLIAYPVHRWIGLCR